MSTQQTPSVLAEIQRQAAIAHKRMARHFPWMREDIAQEAWVHCLEHAHRYNPKDPGARVFFTRIALLWLGPHVSRMRLPVSVSRAVARDSAQLDGTAVPIFRDDGSVRSAVEVQISARVPGPDDVLLDEEERQQNQRELARLRLRMRREAEGATRRLPRKVQAVGAMVLGLDGEPTTPAGAAAEVGMSKPKAEAAWKRYRDACRKTQVMALRKRVEAMEILVS